MSNQKDEVNSKIEFFVAQQAVERILSSLLAFNIPVSVSIIEILRNIESCSIEKLYGANHFIEGELIKHEDDGYPDSLYSYFLLSLVDMIAFFQEKNVDYLIAAQDSAIEYYLYQAANDFMISNNESYYVLTDENNDAIENSPLIINEKIKQKIDRNKAKKDLTK